MPSRATIALEDFCRQNDTNFDLGSVDLNAKQAVWEQCLDFLSRDDNNIMLPNAVMCLRILSRDETFRSQFSEPILSKLVCYIDPKKFEQFESRICLESLKVLSNLIFKQPDIIMYLKSLGIISHSIDVIKSCYREPTKQDLVIIALKVVFLISGFDSSTRLELVDQYHAFEIFNNLLDSFDRSHLTVSDTETVLEALKALFNIVFVVRDREDLKMKFSTDISRLVAILRGFLICPVVDGNKTELVCRIVHLLTVIPRRFYKSLLCSTAINRTGPSTAVEENHAQPHLTELADSSQMPAIDVLLDFLNSQLEFHQSDHHLDITRSSSLRLDEALCPILNGLTRLCQSSRSIRKYCRSKILPPLGKDVTRLPEEGSTLRNRLCKLLTNPSQDINELAAVLIFVLCKENIGRAVKYTGFGNFAGFLARHALLGQPKPKSRKAKLEGQSQNTTDNEMLSEDDYSTNSSDSDTEEYDRLRDSVNPVTGRWEAPQPNPMDGMTDEQKEYLAMDLVQKIDRLQRSGLIQPGTVGEDGRVKPVEHVLELLNQNNRTDTGASNSESD